MGAPVATARGTPAGRKLHDGYQAFIALSRAPQILFWEKTVQAPGQDGGEPIDQTTMHNEVVRTKAPRGLVDFTDAVIVAAYDPAVYDEIMANCNIPQTLTIVFSDGATLAFYGYLRSFIPAAMQEGTQPEATVTFVVTNFDPVECSEELPVMTPGSGTCY